MDIVGVSRSACSGVTASLDHAEGEKYETGACNHIRRRDGEKLAILLMAGEMVGQR